MTDSEEPVSEKRDPADLLSLATALVECKTIMKKCHAPLLLSLSLASAILTGCPGGSGGGMPAPGSKEYLEAVSQFYVGTIALQTGEKDLPLPSLEKALALAPEEPAILANLALIYTRKNELKKANEYLEKAQKLAPEAPEIAEIEGFLRKGEGKFTEAMAAYRRSKGLKALYQLAELAPRLGAAEADAQELKALEDILVLAPENLPAQLRRGKLLAKKQDTASLAALYAKLEARKSRWNAAAQAKLAALPKAPLAQQPREFVALERLVKRDRDYQSGKIQLQNSSEETQGDPLQRFLKLPNPPATPAKPDTGLTYAPASTAPGTVALSLSAESKPTVLALPTGATALAAFDFDDMKGSYAEENKVGARHTTDDQRDFQLEVAAAGPSGLKLYDTDASGALKPLSTALPPGPCTGVWVADIEADGDLDLIISPASGKPLVLQNNGDRTFTPTKGKFDAVACPIRAFAWADFDSDGDTDPAFVDASGKLVRYTNERSGSFKLAPATVEGTFVALAVAEVNGDTSLDLLALEKGGEVSAVIEDKRTPLVSTKVAEPQALLTGDMDNNGATDLIVAGKTESELWLGESTTGTFAKEPIKVPFAVTSIADLNGDSLLDLVGATSGKPVQALASSKEKYGSITISLKAKVAKDPADKINTLCIGGAFEVRAGLLYQKVPVTSPQMHLGLGTYTKPDVVRMFWPTGHAQGEFAEKLKAGEPLVADQQLGASCPFLFTWDGEKMVFVTDCIWRSPLGLKINAQDTAGVTQTEDWVKIRGDQLRPKDGFLNLAITAELHETHFFDHLSLLTVDHPEDTEIFVDERFSPTQPPLLKVLPTGPVQPVAEARGWKGQDLTEVVAQRDGRYVDDFGRGKYQGIAGDHWLEVALPDDAPRGKPLYLIAHGWLHPTNTSINVALSQDKTMGPPQGLSLWTPDTKGGWAKRRDALGFPEGKLKTVVLRIDNTFQPGAARRVRLRTNLEIFWDQVTWAEVRPDSTVQTQRLTAHDAVLDYRGFSVVKAVDRSSPELPLSYTELAGLAPRWRDLVGYCTRFGDVLPLLTGIDDRYAILNAGDELRFRFKAPSAPKPGWKRDYVLIGDGWVKDGNINTTFGKTVGPYPLHSVIDYTKAIASLEDDPAYKKHAADFQNYHTRWIGTEAFENALRP